MKSEDDYTEYQIPVVDTGVRASVTRDGSSEMVGYSY
jgi:hypothetical protein